MYLAALIIFFLSFCTRALAKCNRNELPYAVWVTPNNLSLRCSPFLCPVTVLADVSQCTYNRTGCYGDREYVADVQVVSERSYRYTCCRLASYVQRHYIGTQIVRNGVHWSGKRLKPQRTRLRTQQNIVGFEFIGNIRKLRNGARVSTYYVKCPLTEYRAEKQKKGSRGFGRYFDDSIFGEYGISNDIDLADDYDYGLFVDFLRNNNQRSTNRRNTAPSKTKRLGRRRRLFNLWNNPSHQYFSQEEQAANRRARLLRLMGDVNEPQQQRNRETSTAAQSRSHRFRSPHFTNQKLTWERALAPEHDRNRHEHINMMSSVDRTMNPDSARNNAADDSNWYQMKQKMMQYNVKSPYAPPNQPPPYNPRDPFAVYDYKASPNSPWYLATWQKAACFSGDALVITPNGRVKIDQLAVGDQVLTLDPVNYWPYFTRIHSILHRKPNESAVFVKIDTENNRTLYLTPKHLLYATESCNAGKSDNRMQAVYAYEAERLMCVRVLHANLTSSFSQVRKVSIIRLHGIYAPYTEAGSLIANGIYTSCHSGTKHEALANIWLRFVDFFYNSNSIAGVLRRTFETSVIVNDGSIDLPWMIEWTHNNFAKFFEIQSLF